MRAARRGPAERADIDPVFVSLLENEHRQPSLTVLLNLERVLGLNAGELSRRVAQGPHDSADATRPKGTARRR